MYRGTQILNSIRCRRKNQAHVAALSVNVPAYNESARAERKMSHGNRIGGGRSSSGRSRVGARFQSVRRMTPKAGSTHSGPKAFKMTKSGDQGYVTVEKPTKATRHWMDEKVAWCPVPKKATKPSKATHTTSRNEGPCRVEVTSLVLVASASLDAASKRASRSWSPSSARRSRATKHAVRASCPIGCDNRNRYAKMSDMAKRNAAPNVLPNPRSKTRACAPGAGRS